MVKYLSDRNKLYVKAQFMRISYG